MATVVTTSNAARTNRAVGLVCVAHFFSHFYLLLLPPLFPVLAEYLGVGYTELGFALTAFSIVSGFTQAPMGFAVDRYGAQRILICGIALEGIAFALMGLSPVFAIFVFLLGVAGIANSVYHPADYAILNRVVQGDKIGRAFSFHTAAGLLGEALAPATILLLAVIIDWRLALFVCGLLGVAVAVALLVNSKVLQASDSDTKDPTSRSSTGIKFLFTAPILMGVLFFVGISMVQRGVTGFSPSALHEAHGMSLGVAGTLLSAWLFAAPVGVLVGGQIADRTQQFATLISACFLIIAACIILLVTLNPPLILSGVLFAIGGFFAGVVSPSRDMLIRSVTPPGQAGKVFGFVSTGFNIGGIIAPPLYGYLLDNVSPASVFWVAALASILTITTVIGTRRVAQMNTRPS